MSIIHDALKKVQQSLTGKTKEPPAVPSGTTAKGGTYLFETPQAPETLILNSDNKKPVVQNQIKSFFAFICASAIIAGSIWYLFQQFQINIPQIQRQAKKSFYQLLHKEEVPNFKNKKPEDLKPLGQITISPPVNAPANTTPTSAPITLNVHGIMSDAKGNLALINGQVYQEGDEVEGAKIIKINLNSITVNINGTEKTIFVKN